MVQKSKRITQMPYYNTQVPEGKTRADISALLSKYNISNKQWTEYDGKEKIIFQVNTVIDHEQRTYFIDLDIPYFYGIKNGKRELVPLKQRLRMFYSFLKAQLESTEYGYTTEEVFSSYILLQLPNGEKVRAKDLYLSKPELLLGEGEE